MAAAVIIRAFRLTPATRPSFYLAVALAAFVALLISFVVFSTLRRLVFPSAEQFGIGTLVKFLPSGA